MVAIIRTFAFFIDPFSPLSWYLEQASLDLKEFWVSDGQKRKILQHPTLTVCKLRLMVHLY